MKICDLHAHSTASDGTLTPTQLLHLAVKTGLSAVVLCDHNTVEGLPEFTEAAKELLTSMLNMGCPKMRPPKPKKTPCLPSL